MPAFNFESAMSKLYELRTELKHSIDNIKKLKKQYAVLTKIVDESGRQRDLPSDFVKEINEYKKNLNRQVTTITNRISYLDALIDWYEKKDDFSNKVDQIVTLVLNALGVQGESAPEAVDENNGAE